MPDTALAAKVAVENGEDHITVSWPNGERSHFHHVWLRDNCRHPARWSTLTGERKAPTEDIPPGLGADGVWVSDEGRVQIAWNDGAPPSEFSTDWLYANRYDPPRPYDIAPRLRYWDARDANRIDTFAHEAVIADRDAAAQMIDAFLATGFVRITDVPPVDGEVERFANRFAYVREIAFDRVADIRVTPDAYTQGFTDVALPFHTDCSGYTWPPNLMLFHCLENDVRGGAPCYVDGARAVAELRQHDRAALETLCTIPILHRLYSRDADTQHVAPRIILDKKGELAILRYANWTPQPLRPPRYQDVPAFYRAHRQLAKIINDPANRITVQPQPGELLMINNQRILHGRHAFDADSGSRHFQQVYMELEELASRRRVMDRQTEGAAA